MAVTRAIKPIHSTYVLIIVTLFFALGAAPRDDTHSQPTEISRRITAFAFDWLKHEIAGPNPTANGVIAPMSIYDGVAISYIASGGNTRAELSNAFHYPRENSVLGNGLMELRTQLREAARGGKMELALANSIWLDSTYADFREDYIASVERLFGASAHSLAFKNASLASDTINRWASEKTHGKISSVVAPGDFASKSRPGINDEPALVLTSAAYFDADWGSRFNESETSPQDFRANDSQTEQAAMMHQLSVLRLSEDEQLSFLEIPYEQGGYCMWIVLPKNLMPLSELANRLDGEKLMELEKQSTRCNVDVVLPKFEIRTRSAMRDALQTMGATNCFDSGSADFGAMIHPRFKALRVYLQDVRQDAWIEVHEKGTKAAAISTAVHFSIGCSIPERPPVVAFHADHPFVYFIAHKRTGAILFAGWISHPKSLSGGKPQN